MKKIYETPNMIVFSLEAESVIASSGGADATLPNDGYTPFESSRKEYIWGGDYNL